MNATNKFRVIGIKLLQAKNEEEYLKISLESMRDGIKGANDCFTEVIFLREAQADKWRAKCTEWDLATTEEAKDALVPPIDGAVVIVPMEPYYTKLGQQGAENRPWSGLARVPGLWIFLRIAGAFSSRAAVSLSVFNSLGVYTRAGSEPTRRSGRSTVTFQ